MQALLNDPMILAVGAAAFVSIAGIGWVVAGAADSGSKAPKKKVQSVAGRAGIRSKRSASALDSAAAKRKQIQETLKDLEEKQKKRAKKAVSMSARIQQAGFTFTPKTFYIACVVLTLVIGAGMFLTGRPPVIAALAAIGGGVGVPFWFIGSARKRRAKKFSNEFANAIDVIVRGVKSGLPLNDCLKIIARESQEPVKSEFKQLVDGLQMGVSLDEGLRKMFERMPLPEVNFFGIVLAIQQKTGGNLSEALNNLSTVLRARKMMKEKIQALSSEAKASALIIGSLPPGVMGIVYVTTPSYMSLMFTDDLGKMMLLGGGTWMAIGIFVMKRMISFKF